jgi:hypothetical protein
MDMIIRPNGAGEPVMTIKITGENEIFRYAFYMAHGPVDHMGHAKRAFRFLRKRWGKAAFKEHDKAITGGKVVAYGWQVDAARDRD